MKEHLKICFYDTKPYDREFFDRENKKYNYHILYREEKLNPSTAVIAEGCDAVCAFVNDDIGTETVKQLARLHIPVLAMRCAGYNNVDLKEAFGSIKVFRVPAYSPYSVAEHAMGMLLTLNRKLHKAYIRTRDFNFSLSGLTGIDLHGKTAGIIGTGKIGQCFASICKGFGMKIIAYDPYPNSSLPFPYVTLPELLRASDLISLHCPLTKDNYHIIDEAAVSSMKEGVMFLNTSRGALVDSEALLNGLLQGKIRCAGLDVYEEEADMFYEDKSSHIIQDQILSRFLALPNVLITSHQAFLTEEALSEIAAVTLKNIDDFFAGKPTENEVRYQS